MVSVGFANPAVGNTELPATKRLAMPCTLPSASTTPRSGLTCIRVVPMWCFPPKASLLQCSRSSGKRSSKRPSPALLSSASSRWKPRCILSTSSSPRRHSTCGSGRPRASSSSDRVTRLVGRDSASKKALSAHRGEAVPLIVSFRQTARASRRGALAAVVSSDQAPPGTPRPRSFSHTSSIALTSGESKTGCPSYAGRTTNVPLRSRSRSSASRVKEKVVRTEAPGGADSGVIGR